MFSPEVWIGTSGYSYPDWVGDFYPAGTTSGRMLECYARTFPLVELNFTFYRPPTRGMLTRLADRAPPGFRFLVKVPRGVTHEGRDDDLPGFRHAVEGLLERGQLLGVLGQFPQAVHCTRLACDRVAALARELAHLHPAVEFRHRSWDRPGLPGWLADRGADLVAVDVPDLPGLFPRGWAQSGPTAYVRLHSRDRDRWYAGEGQRYDFDYGDDHLGEWLDALADEGRHAGTERALFLFNNCQRSQAAVNARRMLTLLEERGDAFRVIEPPRAAPRQLLLFG